MNKAEKIERLRETLQPGDTVRTILRHVSQSGMTRAISLVVVDGGEVRGLDFLAAEVLDFKIDQRRGGLRIGGCGMDMGFQLVYLLGRVLWPDGFGEPCLHCGRRPKVKPRHLGNCRSGRQHEYRGRNSDPSGWDNDGGYTLNHRWL